MTRDVCADSSDARSKWVTLNALVFMMMMLLVLGVGDAAGAGKENNNGGDVANSP